jgi:hypothetical protein
VGGGALRGAAAADGGGGGGVPAGVLCARAAGEERALGGRDDGGGPCADRGRLRVAGGELAAGADADAAWEHREAAADGSEVLQHAGAVAAAGGRVLCVCEDECDEAEAVGDGPARDAAAAGAEGRGGRRVDGEAAAAARGERGRGAADGGG